MLWCYDSSVTIDRGLEMVARSTMDPLRNGQNFDLDKFRQKYHHSLKEHRKISKIPKFRCEML